jgi:hypothetical protein
VRIITSGIVAGFVVDGALLVEASWTLALSALVYLRRAGVRLEDETSLRGAAAAPAALPR